MKICGEPDKPEVKKHMEDLDSAWDSVTALFAKREENLIHAMEKAMEFHETLQVCATIFVFIYKKRPCSYKSSKVFLIKKNNKQE